MARSPDAADARLEFPATARYTWLRVAGVDIRLKSRGFSMVGASRRTFLAAGILALLLPGALRLRRAAGVGSPDEPGGSGPVEIFRDPEAARSIGRRYLAAYPHEAANVRRLAAELEAERPRGPEGLRRALADRRQRDFRDGSVVVVAGWVLARTEARACALTVV